MGKYIKNFDDLNEGAHAEPWDDVHKRLIDKRFFSCVEDYEPAALIEKLKMFYKGNRSAEEIANKIKEACEDRGDEKGMNKFIIRVLLKLEGK